MEKTFKTVPVAEHHIGRHMFTIFEGHSYSKQGFGILKREVINSVEEIVCMYPDGRKTPVTHVLEEAELQAPSLLDQFAMAAMQGLIADGHVGRGNGSLEQIAELAYEQAEAMVKERSER